jgi:hypothetical protein
MIKNIMTIDKYAGIVGRMKDMKLRIRQINGYENLFILEIEIYNSNNKE